MIIIIIGMYFSVDVKDMKISDYSQSYDIILAFICSSDTGEPHESIQPEEIKACIWVCTEEVSVSSKFQRLICNFFRGIWSAGL